MMCRQEWLSLFSPHCPTTSMILRNNTVLIVQGTVHATINVGGHTTNIILRDILFIPKNLISTS
jgi:hypothetical protein